MRKKEKTGQQTVLSLLWTAGSTPPCNVRVWGEEPDPENYLYVCGLGIQHVIPT